jgi:ribosome-associated toxin RatA of RatAB toxin-antitoxin module
VACAATAFPGSASADNPAVHVKFTKVEGSDTPKVVVTSKIDAPPDKVWAIVSDCSKYKQRMPRIAAAQELSVSGNVHTCQVTLEMPFPLSNLTATTEATHTENAETHTYARRWKLVKGDYKFNTGSWEVKPVDGDPASSQVVYTVHAEPNSAVPDWLKEKAQKKSLPELIVRVRDEANKLK